MSPPNGLAVDHGRVGADMLAGEKRHPHMPRLYRGPELFGRFNGFTTASHAAQIVDGLAENGESRRHDIMRGIVQALRFTYEKLVVDPAVLGNQLVGEFVVGGDNNVVG